MLPLASPPSLHNRLPTFHALTDPVNHLHAVILPAGLVSCRAMHLPSVCIAAILHFEWCIPVDISMHTCMVSDGKDSDNILCGPVTMRSP